MKRLFLLCILLQLFTFHVSAGCCTKLFINKLYQPPGSEFEVSMQAQNVFIFDSTDSMYVRAYGCGCNYVIEGIYFNDSLLPLTTKLACRPGMYKVVTKFNYSAGFAYKFTIINSLEVGVQKYEQDLPTMKLFPNPAHEMLTITSNEAVKNLVIYDSNSLQLREFESNTSIFKLPLEEFLPGIYFICITTESNKKTVRKLVVY